MSLVDRTQVTDREVYALTDMVEDRGWLAFERRTKVRIEALKKSLLNPSVERRAKLPDNYLRGQIEALEWALEWPTKLVAQRGELELEEGRMRRQREAADLFARLGSTFPGAGSGLPEVQ